MSVHCLVTGKEEEDQYDVMEPKIRALKEEFGITRPDWISPYAFTFITENLNQEKYTCEE